MKKALDQNNKMVDIIESVSENTYHCSVCGENLTRKFGAQKQYYAHPKGLGEDCELKIKLILKQEELILQQSESNILSDEFYNKKFDNISIELSDYMSDDGYPLTKEQKDIIDSTEERIKISALAGSAKSSTLYYYSKSRPFNKILYLVYNTAMKTEAQNGNFGKLNFVDVKTVHGLAFGYVGRFYKDKLTLNYGTVDIIKDLNLNWHNDMELAVKINEMMKQYMLSDSQTFNDLELFKDDKMRGQIISLSEKLWNMMKSYKNNIKVTHDFYLKLFQLSQQDLSKKYDIILLDEAQDSSKMMFDIIANSNVKSIVICGDRFQALYSWRNAVNIMPLFEAKEYTLTTSFRVSQNIAHIANLIIGDMSDNDIQMKGFNTKQTIVDKIDKSKPYVCLCRTNAFIFAEVAEALYLDKNKKLYFEGSYKSYNFENISDCYYFSIGKQTKNKILSKFKNYNELEDYSEKTKDLELLALIRMVKKYGSRIIDIVNGIKNNSVTKKESADILFSTIHRSKGQNYLLPVYISDDHFDIESEYYNKFIEVDPEKKKVNENIFEEMAIVYVACTRCAREIELSDSIKRYLLLRHKTNGHELHNVINNIGGIIDEIN